MKLASIDIGTNTVRLLIADIDEAGHMVDCLLKREITRLGGGFDGSRLNGESKKRTMKALKDFASIIEAHGVHRVRCAATSIVREAGDGKSFIDEVRRDTGLVVDVITGELEASLALKGVLSALDGWAGNAALVFDIGGGSTEYIVAEEGKVADLKSLNMGVVSLTENCLGCDPPSKSDILKIGGRVDAFLLELKKDLQGLDLVEGAEAPLLVGTAGTITTLAALDQKLEVYDTRKINNYKLSKRSVSDIFDRLVTMTNAERAAVPGLEEGREDLIIAGTIIVLRTMETFGFDEMTVSDYGLLEGLLLDLAESEDLS